MENLNPTIKEALVPFVSGSVPANKTEKKADNPFRSFKIETEIAKHERATLLLEKLLELHKKRTAMRRFGKDITEINGQIIAMIDEYDANNY